LKPVFGDPIHSFALFLFSLLPFPFFTFFPSARSLPTQPWYARSGLLLGVLILVVLFPPRRVLFFALSAGRHLGPFFAVRAGSGARIAE